MGYISCKRSTHFSFIRTHHSIHTFLSTMRSLLTIFSMVFLTLLIGSTWGKPVTYLVENEDAALEPYGYKGGPEDPINYKHLWKREAIPQAWKHLRGWSWWKRLTG